MAGGRAAPLRFGKIACSLAAADRPARSNSGQRAARASLLPVDVPAVPDLHHEHHKHGVLDLVEDSVIAHADAVKLAFALQLHAPRRVLVFDQPVDGFAQPVSDKGVCR